MDYWLYHRCPYYCHHTSIVLQAQIADLPIHFPLSLPCLLWDSSRDELVLPLNFFSLSNVLSIRSRFKLLGGQLTEFEAWWIEVT